MSVLVSILKKELTSSEQRLNVFFFASNKPAFWPALQSKDDDDDDDDDLQCRNLFLWK